MDARKPLNRINFDTRLLVMEYLETRRAEIEKHCPTLDALAIDGGKALGVKLTGSNIKFVLDRMKPRLVPSTARIRQRRGGSKEDVFRVLLELVMEVAKLRATTFGDSINDTWAMDQLKRIGIGKDDPPKQSQSKLIDT